MSWITARYSRQDYIRYLSNNGDPFPRSTAALVAGANGMWVTDGAHSLSCFIDGIYYVQKAQRECITCGAKVARGISGEWTDSKAGTSCDLQTPHKVEEEEVGS